MECHVADICDKVILGMPFFSESGGTLNTKEGTISIGKDVMPCLVLDGKPSSRMVYITKECIMPSDREVILPGRALPRKGEKVCRSTAPMLFEPNQSFFRKHGLMACPSTVMNNKSVVPIRVFNPTEEPIALKDYKEGIRCGYLTMVTMGQEIVSRAELVSQVGVSLAESLPDKKMSEYLQVFIDACENLCPEEQELVRAKLVQYQDVFSKGDDDLGRTNVMEHKIITKTENQRPRPLPPKQSAEVERQVQLLLKSGMISVSDSAWSSPIVCVTKKDGSMRMCCDYRKLNDVTIKDAHPIPPINESIDALSGAKYFCSLDLVSGYHQVQCIQNLEIRPFFVLETVYIIGM